ncbi:flavohemoprotein [Aphanothece hegewaldii CCALA 016]|uniref:Flavohemoprotein n=1 Tax=Aphanothece hegewaldii CCALA 016 TaxID=2107694 RepID=A0A2T1LTH2_9CHRO|nr:globin family protein [Aphanothece hegewaldii]PSF33904.1 flavohemoprotein [Aphanothece hegewaldii CCALA 016]
MSLNVELLESSFSQIKEQRTDFTTCFYNNLFVDYPEVKPLFAQTQMEEQPKKLFKSLVLIVESLRQPDVLTNALKGLGSRHIDYGVLPEHYLVVGNTILKALAICLEDAWTLEVEQAWSEAYSVVMKLMLEGAKEAEARVL